MSEIDSDLEKKILAEIEKTGFAAELRVVKRLLDSGWRTEHSVTYEDLDQHISREIDIVAHKGIYDENLDFTITLTLVIEVKKSDRPWVFFMTSTSEPFFGVGWSHVHRTVNARKKRHFQNSGTSSVSLFSMDTINAGSLRDKGDQVGKAFHEFGKKPGEPSRIFEALMSTCKATWYQCEKYRDADDSDFDPAKNVRVEIYLPLVVVQGELFTVSLPSESSELKLEKTERVPVEVRYASPNYREYRYDARFFPDVVSFDGFDTYIERIESWLESMNNSMKKVLVEEGKLPRSAQS